MAASRRALAAAGWLCLLVLLLGACSATEQVLSVDEAKQRRISILTATRESKAPPGPGFQTLSRSQVGASLRSIRVRVSNTVSFNRGDPKPFLTEEQIGWLREAIVAHLPGLARNQRLKLEFRDQFFRYPVVVELWGEGETLVYRFVHLAARIDPIPNVAQLGERPIDWVMLHAQPGQEVYYKDNGWFLRDRLFAGGKLDRVARLSRRRTAARSLARRHD